MCTFNVLGWICQKGCWNNHTWICIAAAFTHICLWGLVGSHWHDLTETPLGFALFSSALFFVLKKLWGWWESEHSLFISSPECVFSSTKLSVYMCQKGSCDLFSHRVHPCDLILCVGWGGQITSKPEPSYWRIEAPGMQWEEKKGL